MDCKKEVFCDGFMLYHPQVDKATYRKQLTGYTETITDAIRGTHVSRSVKCISSKWKIHSQWITLDEHCNTLTMQLIEDIERYRERLSIYFRNLLKLPATTPMLVEITKVDFAVDCLNGLYILDPEFVLNRMVRLTEELYREYGYRTDITQEQWSDEMFRNNEKAAKIPPHTRAKEIGWLKENPEAHSKANNGGQFTRSD